MSRDLTCCRATLVALAFLCMQIAAVTHAAEHGDAAHKHDGAPCLIEVLTTSPSIQPAPPFLSIARPTLCRTLQIAAETPPTASPDSFRRIRAPPLS